MVSVCVPALLQLGETIKYKSVFYTVLYFILKYISKKYDVFCTVFQNIFWNICFLTTKHRRQIGHYRLPAALEAMEGIVGFEVALQRYVHQRLRDSNQDFHWI